MDMARPVASPTDRPSSEIQWAPVASSAELAVWEAAWSLGTDSAGMADKPRQFPSSLLADPDVVILAGYHGPLLVAGAIANHTDGVVGLSNVFVPSSGGILVWAGLVTSTQRAFPRISVVGYQQGHDLEAARASGFEVIGPLRVWVRKAMKTFFRKVVSLVTPVHGASRRCAEPRRRRQGSAWPTSGGYYFFTRQPSGIFQRLLYIFPLEIGKVDNGASYTYNETSTLTTGHRTASLCRCAGASSGRRACQSFPVVLFE
jgi:hypothetical protein